LSIALVLGAPSTSAGQLSEGVVKYLRGQDRQAISNLREERSLGGESPLSHLALSDLYVIHGDLESARKVLSETLSDARGESATQLKIWLAWIEFLDKHYGKAARMLKGIIRSSASEETGLEARATLAWQQLLLGHNHAASKILGQLTEAGPPSDYWYLLEGQALMWSGQVGTAAQRFRELTARFPGSTLVDDAERDAAWCEYLEGDIERALAALEKIIAQYDRAPYRRRNVLRVRWPLVAKRGPAILRDKMWRAYKRRPRGQFPLAFLVSVTDRFAAPDARQLLAYIDKESGGQLSPKVELAAGVASGGDVRAEEATMKSRRTGAAEAKTGRNNMAGLVWLLVALLLVALLTIARRVRIRKRKAWSFGLSPGRSGRGGSQGRASGTLVGLDRPISRARFTGPRQR